MMTYFWYYLIGFLVTFVGLALVSAKRQDTSANHAVFASLFWPLVIPFAVFAAIYALLIEIFEKLSRP